MRLGLAPLIFLHLQGLGAPEPQYIHVPDGYDHIVERDYDNVNIPIQEGSEQQPAQEKGGSFLASQDAQEVMLVTQSLTH